MLSTTNGSSYRKHVRGAEFASILGSTVGLYSFVIYLKILYESLTFGGPSVVCGIRHSECPWAVCQDWRDRQMQLWNCL